MTVRIVADDLTGALDTAVQFTRSEGPLPVFLDEPAEAAGSAALDIGTRELPPAEAIARAARAAGFLAGAAIAFRKIDSQMRGHWAAEMKATIDGGFASCVLAPAYPAQGRVTRRRQQWLRQPSGALSRLGAGIDAVLAEVGIGPLAPPDTRSTHDCAVHVFDAETDDDLRRVVREALVLPRPILWCGSAGLAGALAGGAQRIETPDAPILAIVGSHHPASLAQVQRATGGLPEGAHLPSDAAAGPGDAIDAALARHRAVLVTFPFAAGTEAGIASAEIRRRLTRIIAGMKPPPLLFASGGETLRAICEIVGAASLAVEGEVESGVPISTVNGGAWNGVRVISKSGGFGDGGFLARLLRCPAPPPSPPPRTVP